MTEKNPIDGIPAVPVEEEKFIEFTGASGKHQVPEALYNDMMQRFRGEKSALENKFDKQMEEITGKYNELESNFKEVQKLSLSDLDRVELEKKEKEEQIAELQNQTQSTQQKYQNYRIKSEIQSVVNKYSDKLVSPQHMPFILESVLKPELKEDKVLVGGKEFEEAFKEYISLEENKSLLRNSLIPGSGTLPSSNTTSGGGAEQFDINKMKNMSQQEINEYMDKFV